MGVFVGLVVVRGTGEAEGSVTATVNPAPPPAKQAEPPPPAAPADPPPPEPAPPPAADPTALLTFNVSPRNAVVTVNGAVAADGKAEVPLADGKARVRLVARADGYRSYEKSHLVTGDEAIRIDLVKKPRRSSGGSKGGASGPGGLIDLR
ncbi:MAG TPA: hypothetical protein VFU21_16535 [Kofleriaceae bacterium]|nr:hypothetical protein [Kofleriaceae bacterium]